MLVLGLLLMALLPMLQLTSAECDHYYILFERETDTVFEDISPKRISDLHESSYNWFNATEEYKIIQKNKNCILELSCINSMAKCPPKLHIPNRISSDIRYNDTESTTVKQTTTEKLTTAESTTTEKLTTLPELTITESTTTEKLTTLPELTTTESTTTEKITTETKSATPESTTTEKEITKTGSTTPETTTTEKTTTIIESTTPERTTTEKITTTTEITESIDNTAADYNKRMAEKKEEHTKIAVIGTSAVMGGTMIAYVLKKIWDARKYGSYRIPDPVHETTV